MAGVAVDKVNKVNKVNEVNGLTPNCMTLQNTLSCPILPATKYSLIYLQ